MLHLGCVTYNLLKDWDLETIIRKLEEAGYEAVEVGIVDRAVAQYVFTHFVIERHSRTPLLVVVFHLLLYNDFVSNFTIS